MDGDIDIQEHNILDNPLVTDMLSDLSRVKTEVKVEFDVPRVEHDEQQKIKKEIDTGEYEGRDIVFKKEVDTIGTNVSELETDVQNTGLNNDTVLPSNSIDLLKKENTALVIENTKSKLKARSVIRFRFPLKTIVKKPVATKVVKENKQSDYVYLQISSCSSKSRNFVIVGEKSNCSNLKIMPNKNILGSKIPRIKAKEYLPAVVVLKDCSQTLKESSRYCYICKILFSTKSSLDVHKMATHNFSYSTICGDNAFDIELKTGPEIGQFSGNVNYQNSIKTDDTQDKDINRQIKKRKLSEQDEESVNSAKRFLNTAKNVKFTQNGVSHFDGMVSGEKCYHCNKVFADNSDLINHLYSVSGGKNDGGNVAKLKGCSILKCAYECQICHEIFSNDTVANFHKRFLHPNQSGSIIKTCDQEIKQLKRENDNTYMVMSKIVYNDNGLLLKCLKKKKNFVFTFMDDIHIQNPPIPGTVFKCFKCNLHHVTAHAAYQHMTECNGSNKHYECDKCKCNFSLCDKEMHNLQHLVTVFNKIYVYQNDLINRLLCKCPRCNIFFSERRFWIHLTSPCTGNFRHCNKCNLQIDNETYISTDHKHCRSHLYIYYFDKINKSTVTKKSIVSGNKKIYKLWYCKICNMCSPSGMAKHQCYIRSKYLCKHCDLCFSNKSLGIHRSLLMEEPLNLHNFLLYSVEERKFIQPPMPQYKVCTLCNIHYSNWHGSCHFKDYKTCDVCSKKFEKEHYEIHKQFHTYDLDETINKARLNGGYVGFRLSFYIYQCLYCQCFVHNYDKAVQHAKSHIKKIPEERIYCKICRKTFEASLFKVHKHNLTQYKILKFNYEKLLLNAWFDMFDGLDQFEIGNIVLNSLYKDTRLLDLSVVQKGDPENTLYVCSSCNVIVDKTAIENHVLQKHCIHASEKYKCGVCKLHFLSSENLKTHKELHIKGGKKANFQIVSVMSEFIEDSDIKTLQKLKVEEPAFGNNSLSRQRNDKNDSSIKEITDDEFDANTKNCNEQFNIDSTDSIQSEQSASEDIKTVKLFKCVECKVCIFPSKYVKDHYCSGKLPFCWTCKQFYHKSTWSRHNLVIHKNANKIKFLFEYFQMKNMQGKQQRCILKVAEAFYDNSETRNETSLNQSWTPMEKELQETIIYKYSKNDKDSETVVEEFNEFNKDPTSIDIDKAHNKITQAVSTFNDTNNIFYKTRKSNRSKETSKEKETIGKKIVVVFKCTNCETCTISRKNLKYHSCVPKNDRRFCDICKQWFPTNRWNCHNIIHKTKKKIVIKVVEYKPEKIVYSISQATAEIGRKL